MQLRILKLYTVYIYIVIYNAGMWKRVCVCAYVCVSVCVVVYVCVCACVHVCICECVRACECECMRVCLHVSMPAYVGVCIFMD